MKRGALVAGAAVSIAAGSVLAAPSAFAAGTLPNGFTAAVVAHSGELIQGAIDASQYDVGIYIGPGVHGVRVLGATVTGAHHQGILVQDAHDVLIKDSTVSGDASDVGTPNDQFPQLEEVKGIVLAGTRNVLVLANTVEGNGDGGIGVYDDGKNSATTFAPVPIDEHGVPSIGNVISGNTVKDNLRGCGIVVSAKNPGGGVRNNLVAFNTVLGHDRVGGDTVPGTGGIVIAGGEYGAVQVVHNVVLHNRVTGGFIPGISLHAGPQAVLSGTQLLDNTLTRNGSGAAHKPTGIEIAGAPGATSGTQVLHDTVIGDGVGVFHVGDTGTHIAALSTSGGTQPVGP